MSYDLGLNDITAEDIKFLGYFPDHEFREDYANRVNPMTLETFYSKVNQSAVGGCCTCCTQKLRFYALYTDSELPIKPDFISICASCISRLPSELEVINIANGTPTIRYKK